MSVGKTRTKKIKKKKREDLLFLFFVCHWLFTKKKKGIINLFEKNNIHVRECIN